MSPSPIYNKQLEDRNVVLDRMAGTKVKSKTVIVKVQLQAYPKPGHDALVYARNHKYQHFQAVSKELLAAMPGEDFMPRKAYFKALITENDEDVLVEILLGQPVKWQEW